MLRTFSWEVACPSTGINAAVGVAGTGVADGRGVCVGGKVEVMMTGGVGVGVSGGGTTSALQAVLKDRSIVRRI